MPKYIKLNHKSSLNKQSLQPYHITETIDSKYQRLLVCYNRAKMS